MNKNTFTCQVILLPTNKVNKCTGLEIGSIENELTYYKPTKEEIGKPLGTIYGKSIPQHLYFISNEPIKEGDWFKDAYNNIKKATKHDEDFIKKITSAFKIEATTDASLSLPLVPTTFIEQYVKEQGKIKEVELEVDFFNVAKTSYDLKLIKDDSGFCDYSVSIIKSKDSWSREEIIVKLEMLYNDFGLARNHWLKVWIEDNL